MLNLQLFYTWRLKPQYNVKAFLKRWSSSILIELGSYRVISTVSDRKFWFPTGEFPTALSQYILSRIWLKSVLHRHETKRVIAASFNQRRRIFPIGKRQSRKRHFPRPQNVGKLKPFSDIVYDISNLFPRVSPLLAIIQKFLRSLTPL